MSSPRDARLEHVPVAVRGWATRAGHRRARIDPCTLSWRGSMYRGTREPGHRRPPSEHNFILKNPRTDKELLLQLDDDGVRLLIQHLEHCLDRE